MKISIRNMTNKDIDFVISANNKVHEASNQTGEVFGLRERLEKDVLVEDPKAYVIIAECDEKPIGMALYSTVYFADEGQCMWLSNILVEKEYQGKGIASTVIEYLKEICKTKGYYAIACMIDIDNVKSIKLFKNKNGIWLDNFKSVIIK